MTRLNNIYFSLLDIQKTRSDESKKEKIFSLINYVEQISKDVKSLRSNLEHPYMNENKIIHTLLEIQIQTRLMQVGGEKRCQEIAVHLFNIRVLAENALSSMNF
ncbi:hypothetical protein BWC54_001492 [Salmonella enterica subsp. enterica serovar Oslo]|uniref:Uncharacterized protein n=1 Tax=Salmonella enterica TaxID=28901 RepID=A0A760BGH4_SALER|nr:hypothetical protein [Salmonella enterica subsp. enterica serovar Newport]EAO5526411.1 hypothetical protein [Salmonella enterica subsp. enterica serovar Hvittingfoss]EAV1019832.1 hypothetical protein [Salmonella enterica]EBX7465277.1 hypothetical protein [Salmonella enterica subsp. enterica serovar Bareilly]ECF3778937.1 hypothetical protein [Salmonella enterica subsp. enterica serovar Oslo]EDR2105287.1 hypothetical protein [Salmonella enterica subsp. enterica]EDV9204031.1 hypothetical prot